MIGTVAKRAFVEKFYLEECKYHVEETQSLSNPEFILVFISLYL